MRPVRHLQASRFVFPRLRAKMAVAGPRCCVFSVAVEPFRWLESAAPPRVLGDSKCMQWEKTDGEDPLLSSKDQLRR